MIFNSNKDKPHKDKETILFISVHKSTEKAEAPSQQNYNQNQELEPQPSIKRKALNHLSISIESYSSMTLEYKCWRNYLDDPLNSPNSMLKHNDLRVIRMQVLKLKKNILISFLR